MKKKSLDIGIIIPELTKYGGAERFLIECVSRWQHIHRLTLYASKFNLQLLKEHRVGNDVTLVQLSPYFKGENSFLLNSVLLPKIWEHEIDMHDIYHTHLWPTHLIDIHPSVWYPHEPLRILNDLKFNQHLDAIDGTKKRKLHIYPKYNYDTVSDVTYDATLKAINSYDQLGTPDRIVANSRFSAKHLEEVYGRQVRDIVYPGVNVDEFIYMPSYENILLTIGQLWPHKRIKLLIEAIKHVADVQLYVVGAGPEYDRLVGISENLGVSDRVFFLQNLTNKELQILFTRAFAVAFTPTKEPFGIVVLEAMAAGKPVIGVAEGGFTEVLDESCSFLVPPYPLSVAEKIRYLKDNKDVAITMGLNGLQKVKDYNWDNTASQLLKIIEETHAASKSKHKKRTRSKPRNTLFGAQYYCWYGDGIGAPHWNDNSSYGAVRDMPAMGYYASSHGMTISEHLKSCERMGIDFLLLNLHIDNKGVNEYELASMEHIFRIAEESGSQIQLAIQICPYETPRNDFLELLTLISKVFLRRKNYLKVIGKPLLSIFWTGLLDGNKPLLESLKAYSNTYTFVASSLRMHSKQAERNKTSGLFESFFLYSPLEISSRRNWKKHWSEAYKVSDMGGSGLKAFTVSPGYDDSHMKDPARENNAFRCIEREDGQVYREMWEFILSQKTPPDMVIITTFNEYHEETHIESSRAYGDRYITMTKEFISRGKRKWRR